MTLLERAILLLPGVAFGVVGTIAAFEGSHGNAATALIAASCILTYTAGTGRSITRAKIGDNEVEFERVVDTLLRDERIDASLSREIAARVKGIEHDLPVRPELTSAANQILDAFSSLVDEVAAALQALIPDAILRESAPAELGEFQLSAEGRSTSIAVEERVSLARLNQLAGLAYARNRRVIIYSRSTPDPLVHHALETRPEDRGSVRVVVGEDIHRAEAWREALT